MPNDMTREIQLGPFDGGLNSSSEPEAAADNELVFIENLTLESDKSYTCRWPIYTMFTGGADFNNTLVKAIGYGSYQNNYAIFLSGPSGVWSYVTDGTPPGVKVKLASNVNASTALQYKDDIYFIAEPYSPEKGGKIDQAAATWIQLANMPQGQSAVIFKERMWIVPGKHATTNRSRLSFSAIGDPSSWNSADFFDISPGDGGNLVDICIFNNNLLLFKQDATYYLSYDSKPADATIVKISNRIGSSNYRCVDQIDNNIYVMHKNNVYQLVNFNWVKLNTKVPFILDQYAPVARDIKTFVSAVGNLLICRYHNNIYVYNQESQSWANWTSRSSQLHNFGPLVRMPSDALFTEQQKYYAGSCLFQSEVFRIINGHNTSIESELRAGVPTPITIECGVKTKIYNFGSPNRFKRMWSWGAEVKVPAEVFGHAIPYAVYQGTDEQTMVGKVPFSIIRRFVRFNKGLRFRDIQFGVYWGTNGSVTEGPGSLYGMTVNAKAAETTTKSAT